MSFLVVAPRSRAHPKWWRSGHENEVNQVKANPSRTKLASCSDDRTGRIWNIEDIGSTRAIDDHPIVLSGHEASVSNIVWSPFTPSGEHEIVATWVKHS